MNKINSIAVASVLAMGVVSTSASAFTNPFRHAPADATPTAANDKTEDASRADGKTKGIARGAGKGALKGCGVGAAMGLIGGLLHGGLNPGAAIAGCKAGAVMGAVAGGVQAYQEQLKAARELQGHVTVGAITTIQEKTVQTKQGPVQALDNLTLNLDGKKVVARSNDIKKILDRIGEMANKQKDKPLTIKIYARGTDAHWMSDQLTAAIQPGKATVEIKATATPGEPAIVITPVPDMGQ
jgi:hypothetical protein